MGKRGVDGDCISGHSIHLGLEIIRVKVASSHLIPVVYDANGFLPCLVSHAHTLLDQPNHELHRIRRYESGQIISISKSIELLVSDSALDEGGVI